jgi:hypothetical protein
MITDWDDFSFDEENCNHLGYYANVTEGLAASICGILESFVIFLQCSGKSMKLHLSGSHLLFFKSFSPIAEVGHCHPDRGNSEGAVRPSCLACDLPFPCIMYIK